MPRQDVLTVGGHACGMDFVRYRALRARCPAAHMVSSFALKHMPFDAVWTLVLGQAPAATCPLPVGATQWCVRRLMLLKDARNIKKGALQERLETERHGDTKSKSKFTWTTSTALLPRGPRRRSSQSDNAIGRTPPTPIAAAAFHAPPSPLANHPPCSPHPHSHPHLHCLRRLHGRLCCRGHPCRRCHLLKPFQGHPHCHPAPRSQRCSSPCSQP